MSARALWADGPAHTIASSPLGSKCGGDDKTERFCRLEIDNVSNFVGGVAAAPAGSAKGSGRSGLNDVFQR